jgi:hypothetical protein
MGASGERVDFRQRFAILRPAAFGARNEPRNRSRLAGFDALNQRQG